MKKHREGRWLCQRCGRENLGRHTSCEEGCGVSRPENVRFYLPENSPIVTDPDLLEISGQKPNWNCDYCSGANPSAKDGHRVIGCAHCGQARDAGDTTYETQTFNTSSVPRTAADANPRRKDRPRKDSTSPRQSSSGKRPRRGGILGPVLLMLFGAILVASLIASLLIPASTSEGTIISRNWSRSVHVQELRTYHDQGWQMPQGARVLSHETRVRDQEEVVVGTVPDTKTEMKSVKIGERPYVCGHKDLGNGFFEDVECIEDITEMQAVEVPYDRPIYETRDILDEWYVFEYDKWDNYDVLKTEGSGGKAPYWAKPKLSELQRISERSEVYRINVQVGPEEVRSVMVSPADYQKVGRSDPVQVFRNVWGQVIRTTLPEPVLP